MGAGVPVQTNVRRDTDVCEMLDQNHDGFVQASEVDQDNDQLIDLPLILKSSWQEPDRRFAFGRIQHTFGSEKSINTIWDFEDLGRFITSVKHFGWTEMQTTAFAVSLKKIFPEPRVFSLIVEVIVPSLLSHGVAKPQEILTYMMQVRDKCILPGKTDLESFIFAIIALVEAGITSLDSIEAIFRSLYLYGTSDKNYSSSLRILESLMKNTKLSSQQDTDRVVNNLQFLFKHSAQAFQMLRSLQELEINFASFTVENLGDTLAQALNNKIRQNGGANLITWATQDLAILIDRIHDAEGMYSHTDKIREQFCRKLTPEAAYQLIVEGGADLYTSTFFKIWEAQGVEDLESWLKEVDPFDEHVSVFVLRLFNYDQTKLLEAYLPLLLSTSLSALAEEADPVRSAGFLGRFLVQFKEKTTDEEKANLAEFLYTEYVDPRRNDFSYRAAIAYLIKLCRGPLYLEEFINGLEMIDEQELPPIPAVEIPIEQWLRDGVVTAQLVFYSDEKWFEITSAHYRQATENGNRVWTTDVEYMRSHYLDSKVYQVYRRIVGDVSLRIVLSKEDASANTGIGYDAMVNADTDILVHRGHSFHLRETFPEQPPEDISGKLIFGGSCGSYGEMMTDQFLSRYDQHFLMGDSNRGEGAVNNHALDALMEAVVQGKRDWQVLKAFADKGLILPDNPSFLIGKFLHLLKKMERYKD